MTDGWSQKLLYLSYEHSRLWYHLMLVYEVQKSTEPTREYDKWFVFVSYLNIFHTYSDVSITCGWSGNARGTDLPVYGDPVTECAVAMKHCDRRRVLDLQSPSSGWSVSRFHIKSIYWFMSIASTVCETQSSLPSQHDQLATFCPSSSGAISRTDSNSSGIRFLYCTPSCSPLPVPQLLASPGEWEW